MKGGNSSQHVQQDELAKEARDLIKYAKSGRQHDVLTALGRCGGSVTEAAMALGCGRPTVRAVLNTVRGYRDAGVSWGSNPAPYRRSDAADTIPAPTPTPTPPPARAHKADVQALLKLVHGRKGADPIAFEELCDRLDTAPGRVRSLIEEARDAGYDVEIDEAHVGRAPQADPSREVTVEGPAPVNGRYTIALVGDIHFGSKQHMRAEFEDFCRYAYHERGVRRFLQVGDMIDGAYKFSFQEQSVRGFEDQCDYAIANLPGDFGLEGGVPYVRDGLYLPGATWTCILGNHDETFDQNGINVERAMNERFHRAGRTDVEFVGTRGAYVRLLAQGQKRGTIVELWHPKGGAAYAKSYKLQNHIRDYGVGQKPDILAQGHTHQSMYLPERGVHAFVCGCWQGGKSAFGRSIGGAPAIGSWIVEYGVTEHETLRDVTMSWRAYYEGESPRTVEMS